MRGMVVCDNSLLPLFWNSYTCSKQHDLEDNCWVGVLNLNTSIVKKSNKIETPYCSTTYLLRYIFLGEIKSINTFCYVLDLWNQYLSYIFIIGGMNSLPAELDLGSSASRAQESKSQEEFCNLDIAYSRED